MALTITSPNENERYKLFLFWCETISDQTGISMKKLVENKAIENWFYRTMENNRTVFFEALTQFGIRERWELDVLYESWKQGLTFFYPKVLLKQINQQLNKKK